MKSQIFCKDPNYNDFNIFLNAIAIPNKENRISITSTIYKQAEYKNMIQPFVDNLQLYYHKSKAHYLDNVTYKRFVTILRQLCRFFHVYYKSEIKYIGTSYFINYYVYLPKDFNM
uniref:Uncharacterized protein n=1 Tax=viral metagenome TaxID=1070528 RepID=A0A6C0EGJ8_9ZZZZ